MIRFKTIFTVILGIFCSCAMKAAEKPLEDVFLNPDQCHKPLIIWQWMDGLVTKEGITNDLEAFKDAALAGVHNFQIDSPRQMQIGDADNKIGSDNWKEFVRCK